MQYSLYYRQWNNLFVVQLLTINICSFSFFSDFTVFSAKNEGFQTNLKCAFILLRIVGVWFLTGLGSQQIWQAM